MLFIVDKEYDADFFFELTRKTRGYNKAPYKSVCPSCGENLDNYQFIFLEKTSVDNGSRTLKSIRNRKRCIRKITNFG